MIPAAAIAAAAQGGFAVPRRQRVFIGSNTPKGILAFDWNPATAELKQVEVAAVLANVDWIVYSQDRKHIFAASEVDSFNGKPTGEVASYRVEDGKLAQISAQNSAAKGTCYVGLDHSGRVLISADYGGGAAASFKVTAGKLSAAVWSEHYTGQGPVSDRQEAAHAHFTSFSPDDRFAYVNDLGSDCIHFYKLNSETAELTPAGKWDAKPGSGPRTLHFHPNGTIAYCMNELASAVDILRWNKADGSLETLSRFELNPDRSKPLSTGCDTVITRDGRFVYFANRGDDFIYACSADPKTGALKGIGKTPSGGKTPRNFVLDPTERWMLVANQNSSNIAVFARNPTDGSLAADGKTYDCPSPMCILFP
ncbi:lactonase family protein [Occallatibacter riparius]|uniref:Lactonase family protein n=1 Tax=Occallatibacter riparius TaxID=1002689 RepID=A0A9J7BTX3_9BACT|nr:lactonase family protein [Occallatibacter riparius]UWZ86087.1 lactonase family protein [Occallatibacter riparius]